MHWFLHNLPFSISYLLSKILTSYYPKFEYVKQGIQEGTRAKTKEGIPTLLRKLLIKSKILSSLVCIRKTKKAHVPSLFEYVKLRIKASFVSLIEDFNTSLFYAKQSLFKSKRRHTKSILLAKPLSLAQLLSLAY